MTQHATRARGSRLPQAKLNEQQVAAIRTRNGYGVPRWWLAIEYGVHTNTIDKACTYETWAHVRNE